MNEDYPQTNEDVRQVVEANSARLAVSITEGEAYIDSGEPLVTLDQVVPQKSED
jgi:hypothetical protein